MNTIKVQDIKPGMVFDAPVFIDRDNLLVRAHEPVRSTDIERLLKNGIAEVQTEGSLVVAQTEAIPRARLAEQESIRIHGDYDTLRRNWNSARNDLISTAEILRGNFRTLIERKAFNNHEVIEISQKIVTSLFQIPFYLLVLESLQLSESALVNHAIRAGIYGAHLGKTINLTRPRVQELFFAMLLMDMGMFLVPEAVRRSPTSPNPEDWKSLRSHPLIGYKMLVNQAYVKTSLAVVALQHHENYDGTGYPRALRENQIDLLARIASIADRFAALLEDREHREGMLPYDAMRVVLGIEAARFDPLLLRAFLGGVTIYPTGSIVELSTGERGLVLGGNADKPLRPLVRVIRNRQGKGPANLQFLDLNQETQLYVVRALPAQEIGFNIIDEI